MGGKGEIACHKQFLLFPQCFPRCEILKPPHPPQKKEGGGGLLVAQGLPSECKLKNRYFIRGKKHRGEKEKLLVTSNFSFSDNVFLDVKFEI